MMVVTDAFWDDGCERCPYGYGKHKMGSGTVIRVIDARWERCNWCLLWGSRKPGHCETDKLLGMSSCIVCDIIEKRELLLIMADHVYLCQSQTDFVKD